MIEGSFIAAAFLVFYIIEFNKDFYYSLTFHAIYEPIDIPFFILTWAYTIFGIYGIRNIIEVLILKG